MSQQKILIIIPAYNESECITSTICTAQALNMDIVVVNDGSVDTTSESARKCGVLILDLLVNLGIGGAMQTGYKYALSHGYDVAIQFDADGQHNHSYISKLVAALEDEKVDLVIGSRYLQRNQQGFKSTFMRRVGISFLAWIIRVLTKEHIVDSTSGFRAANKRAIRLFAESYPTIYPEPESLVLLYNHGLKFCEIPVEMFDRQGGKSKIRFLDTALYMIEVTTSIIIEALRKKKRLSINI